MPEVGPEVSSVLRRDLDLARAVKAGMCEISVGILISTALGRIEVESGNKGKSLCAGITLRTEVHFGPDSHTRIHVHYVILRCGIRVCHRSFYTFDKFIVPKYKICKKKDVIISCF